MSFAPDSAVERLLHEQPSSWPLLARGIEGLRESRTRAVRVARSEVLVRHIPHRIRSTTAAVDPDSVARRPCFLCRENLPKEERGVALDEGFTAYCNPFPILEKHLTIVHRDHRPQAIAGQVLPALRIAGALPGFFVVYNGPECGASAPDHLHLQACSREVFPIQADARRAHGPSLPDCGRCVLFLRDTDAERLAARVEAAIAILSEVTGKRAEPLLNLSLFHEDGLSTVFLFPRGRHRPRAFETGELTVSPAAIDLSGVLVVPLAEDFERIAERDVASIFDEVTLAPDLFEEARARVEKTV